jgi:hypothetical protein
VKALMVTCELRAKRSAHVGEDLLA